MKYNVSKQLNELIKDYMTIEDHVGMSPTDVFKLVNGEETLYLKVSSKAYDGTTFSVKTETDCMKWLAGKLKVPNVLFYEFYQGHHFLLMSALDGISIDVMKSPNKEELVYHFVKIIKELWSVDITNCPFDKTLDVRLKELKYLFDHDLADVDVNNWEDSTSFDTPQDLYHYLLNNQPEEELCFSHGDVCEGNMLVNEQSEIGYLDLGRAGIADKWMDVAFVVRELSDLQDDTSIDLFFELLGIEPNWDKINYFILLDELF